MSVSSAMRSSAVTLSLLIGATHADRATAATISLSAGQAALNIGKVVQSSPTGRGPFALPPVGHSYLSKRNVDAGECRKHCRFNISTFKQERRRQCFSTGLSSVTDRADRLRHSSSNRGVQCSSSTRCGRQQLRCNLRTEYRYSQFYLHRRERQSGKRPCGNGRDNFTRNGYLHFVRGEYRPAESGLHGFD